MKTSVCFFCQKKDGAVSASVALSRKKRGEKGHRHADKSHEILLSLSQPQRSTSPALLCQSEEEGRTTRSGHGQKEEETPMKEQPTHLKKGKSHGWSRERRGERKRRTPSVRGIGDRDKGKRGEPSLLNGPIKGKYGFLAAPPTERKEEEAGLSHPKETGAERRALFFSPRRGEGQKRKNTAQKLTEISEAFSYGYSGPKKKARRSVPPWKKKRWGVHSLWKKGWS